MSDPMAQLVGVSGELSNLVQFTGAFRFWDLCDLIYDIPTAIMYRVVCKHFRNKTYSEKTSRYIYFRKQC